MTVAIWLNVTADTQVFLEHKVGFIGETGRCAAEGERHAIRLSVIKRGQDAFRLPVITHLPFSTREALRCLVSYLIGYCPNSRAAAIIASTFSGGVSAWKLLHGARM